ncbi:MDGA1-like protein [Mya arenaria]|uniref:MDGA1-like protein n=1 Tax=Mya arenaria TaxID=6604 RepID=A0ABY7E6Z4_MYAAR|nr:MDGA1-like protein [Mya arenaria]
MTAIAGALVLTSDKQYAQLQGDITVTCNTSENVSSVEFKRDNNYVGRCNAFICESTDTNKSIVIQNNISSGNNLFALTIKNFKVNDTGYYTCVNSNKTEQVSGKEVTYAVDITLVTLTPKANPISVIENTPQLFQCLTSICRPKANVTWYLGSEQLTSATVSSPSQDVTASTLNYTSQRKHQNMNIYCQGNGPSQIVCKLGGSTMSSGVSVKEGWEFGLDCSSDGNPSPSFSWTHPGDGSSNPLFIRSINRTHAGRFTIIARSNLIPSEQQTVNLTKDIYVKVEVQCTLGILFVLDPPDPPSCRVGSSAISSNIVSAIRGNTISINCSCDSNPPSRNSWSVPGVSTPTSGQSFDLVVQKATTITLTMENSMQFTNGKNEQGRHESPIEVKVLYFDKLRTAVPPVVKPLKNVTVLEKSQVSVACEVTAGVPNKTIFRWENISDMTSVATEQTLRIVNISRAQGGYYRCNASNFMEPTGYDSTVGSCNNTVYIDMRQK